MSPRHTLPRATARLKVAARPLAALALILVTVPAVAADDTDLVRRQADQRRARQMARELVSSVLDLQLRQLDENGLGELPIYEDIRTMRANLTSLVDVEMAEVVERLVEAQQATGSERETKFIEARRAIRSVVVRLSVERQSLLRRLKAAEIAEQTRRLIALQHAALEATAALPGLPDDRRPQSALQIVEDQRDVGELFVQTVETLDDVRTWDGLIATAASDGLRVLKEAETGRQLDEAEHSLLVATFTDAAGHQEAVLTSLRRLLSVIEAAQGAIDSERSDLAARVRRLRESQQKLREQVVDTGLSEPPEPEAVEAQQQIANGLAELAGRLSGDATTEPLRQQAEAAARAATEALFAADESRTLDEQQRTIDRLTALEEILSEATGDRSDRSATELANAARDLEQARDELQQAMEKHARAARQSATQPQAASSGERSAADQTAKIAEDKELPPAVTSRLADAADAGATAADALAAVQGSDAAQRDAANAAVADAGDAFERAQAAVEEALADTRRSEAAVRIGELARAAEALERAAAAERELAMSASSASKENGLTADQTAAMQQIQSDVTAVATKAAKGVEAAAAQAAETLSKAVESSGKANAALARAAASPGADSKPAAKQAAAQARQTAEQLTQAAASLRNEIGETAGELATLAKEQSAPVATAQHAVEQAAEAVESPPEQAANAAARAAQASAQAETGATSASQQARRAAKSGSKQDAADALDRAAISLAARAQRLDLDRQFAERLAQLASRQQSAVESIAKARQDLESAPSDPAAMSESQKQSARELHGATRQFAAIQRATGQGAAQISGQQQVANVPIREALQAAERLPLPQLPGEPAAEPTEVADSGEGQPAASEAGQQGEGQNAANDPSQQSASSASQQSAASSGAASQAGAGQARGLGTGLVPAAPDETASMMAGPDAQAALAALEAAGLNSMEDVAATESGTPVPNGQGTPTSESAPDQQAAKNGNAAAGTPATSDTQTPNAAGRDATAGPYAAEAGWFAKLPPEVRAAIRASSSQPAPKGYEGRLRRYFESVE